MRAASPVISLSFAGVLLASAPAHGIGFGRVANATQLGQPLDFQAAVKLESDDSLARECVFADVVAGDNRIAAQQVRVTLSGVSGDPERTVRVITTTPIEEPVVTVNLTLGCTSRITRQFVAFVDPPGMALAPQAPSAAAVTPSAGATESPLPDRAPVAAATPLRRDAETRGAAGRVAPTVEARRRPPPAVRVAGLAGPRLQLDAPAVPAIAVAASAPASATEPAAAAPAVESLAVASAASAVEAAAQALARERQRNQALEAEMTRLRAETAAQRQALTSLTVQTRLTRSQRYANPLVYTLAALCLLMTTIVCALLGRRSRDRAVARWLTSEMLARSPEPASTVAAVAVAAPIAADSVVETPESAALPASTAAHLSRIAPPPPAARPLSVEELMDLEQQADFFVALGQDDAAVELLNGAVERDAGASAVPLLRLLELHRRIGDRSGYTQVRARLDRRFNACPPDIDADPARGRSLDDHPGVLARLQAAWPTPSVALATVDALVLRRSLTDERFDLPAFRELLFLQSIATDHVARAGVDVGLLPRADRIARAAPIGGAGSSVDVDLGFAPVRQPASRGPAEGSDLPVLTAAASRFDGLETTPSARRRAPSDAGETGSVDLELEFPELAPATAPR